MTIPDHVRAAIHAGHVAEVVIFCDICGHTYHGDHIGATRDARFAAARATLAARGWTITPHEDRCPDCPPATGAPADVVQDAGPCARCRHCGDVVVAATNAAGRVVSWVGATGGPQCPTGQHHEPQVSTS